MNPIRQVSRNARRLGVPWKFRLLVVVGILSAVFNAAAQPVQVTLRTDKTTIAPGEATLLRVAAQIAPEWRARASQIFSWHVDLIQEFGDPAELVLGSLARPASDSDPATSSAGAVEGNTLRGVRDTFANLATAGIADPVVLFTVPVVGKREGQVTFRVRAGSGADGLSGDFLVAGKSLEEFWTGGDYSQASTVLEVKEAPATAPTLSISLEQIPGQPANVVLEFVPSAGNDHTVQTSDRIGADAVWQDLPGAPHNTGRVSAPLGAGPRFYRLAVARHSNAENGVATPP